MFILDGRVKLVSMHQVEIIIIRHSSITFESEFDNQNYCGFSGAGDNVGIELFLAPEPNEYYSYIRPFYGIQVAIHPQDDYPDMKNPILVQPGYDVKVFVTPSVLISDQAVCSFFCNLQDSGFDLFFSIVG